ncbi:MAG TPA: hypothetical protein VHX59_08800 [Mycobacteriales bacterium]|jgi:hypothetical protein|nr:hypothetical protein [Mycobacteriales bacterium]
MTADTLRRAAPAFPALTVQALRSGADTQVRLSGHLLDADLRLLDETIDWLLAAGARHIKVDAHELAGDRAVLKGWLGGYRQQCLVRRHVLSISRLRASR